ncbi:WXG100 family type VII secretion target [Janibacter indicus]
MALRRQGDKVTDAGDRGANLVERLRALWDGPDFERFAKDWRAAHRQLDDAESAMRTFSRKLVAEAEAQRTKSSIGGSALSGGSAGPAFQRSDGGGSSSDGQAFERSDGGGSSSDGAAFERSDGGGTGQAYRLADSLRDHPLAVCPALPDDAEALELGAFERVETQPAFERVETQPAWDLPDIGSLEPLPAWESPDLGPVETLPAPWEGPVPGPIEPLPAPWERPEIGPIEILPAPLPFDPIRIGEGELHQDVDGEWLR